MAIFLLCGPLPALAKDALAPDFQTLFNGIDMPALLVDPANGRIAAANPAALAFYGFSAKELVGANVDSLNTLSQAQVAEERRLAASQGRNFFLFRHRLKNGELRNVEVFSRPFSFNGRQLLLSLVHDANPNQLDGSAEAHYRQRLEQMVDLQVRELKDGQRRQLAFLLGALVIQALVIGALVVGIRRWRSLQQEKSHLAHLLGNVLDAASEFSIIATDPKGVITRFNKGAEKMLGYSAAELEGKTSPVFLHLPEEMAALSASLSARFGQPVEGFRVFVEEAERLGSATQEWTYIRKDGSRLTVSLVVTTMRDPKGQLTGYLGVAQDISQRRQAEQALLASKERYHSLVAALSEGVVMQNRQGQIVASNQAARRMLGLAEHQLHGKTSQDPWQALDEDGQPFPGERHPAMLTLASGQPHHNVVMGLPSPQGLRWLSINSEPVGQGADGRPDAVVCTFVDITERKAVDDQLRLAASVFANSYEGIMVTDADNRIIEVNPAFCRITGYSAEEVIGRSPNLLASGRQPQGFYQAMWQQLASQDAWRGEIWNRRKSGEVYAEILAISVVRNSQGAIQRYIGVFSDISQLKAHERELDQIAHFDPLTGLPNRRRLNDLLAQRLGQCDRYHQGLAVAFIDLDGFKPINDTYGHQAGDQFLVAMAKRLKGALRQQDVVARIGGDEFVVLLADVLHPGLVEESLNRLLKVINEPVQMEGTRLQVSASIGVTCYPDDSGDADLLLRHADQAMYRAKQAGKNRFHRFDLERDRQQSGYQSWLNRLEQALAEDQLRLYYQPKLDLSTGKVEGAEALLRWQHPSQGLLAPGDFLGHLLGSRLDVPLGQWVLDQALAQLGRWQSAGLELNLSVNISAMHLLQPDFADTLGTLLAAHPQIDPRFLELEIVETAALTDLNLAARTLTQCRRLGVRTALDDFGTGYASLTYLRRLPVDRMKIDQSFVRDMLSDPNDLSIVENVIQMARAFNREVIAEGVETQNHARALLQLGCHHVQGYGVARPQPVDQFEAWLAQWQRQPRWLAPKLPPYHPELALLAAANAHRHWVEMVLASLEAPAAKATLELNGRHCNFGQWYHTAGMARYGHLDAFLALEALHEHSHQVAATLLAAPSSQARQALLDARDQVSAQLGVLIQALGQRKAG
ncbi:EAL domain-containing protein [Gallaecimonas xiamenensis]|uniref:diguanylate cyclase n=1 Tax=Gallaecimonas xiamenensis 3-C-1 TaxID=745411 RepID=K2JIU0_9GAMM|nr:EAL domain-containing protein [Gallaecimonas xiamenensis]EKE75148.1 diguanylate cyclase/phosphodiesterase [Gallaecimonas xiamenensis 3-C-1]